MLDNFKKKAGQTISKWISLSHPNIIYGTQASVIASRSANTYISEEQFKNISTVYVCAKILANTLARLPLNVYQEKEEYKYVLPDDYRHYLLHYQPNEYLDSFHFFNYLELQRNITGNSFARIYRKPNGDAVSLELLQNNQMLDYDKINNQVYYKIKNSKGDIEILHSKFILHFRDITYDGIWGISPIEILRNNASVAYKALSSVDKAYDNDLRATLIIKPRVDAGVITKDKFIELVEEVKKTNIGYEKTGGLVILPSNMEAQPLEMNINDALFLASVKFSDGKIASFYGVPPNLVGLFEQSKFNNVEQMQLNFISESFAAIAKMYRRELDSKLLSKNEIVIDKKSIEFNLRALAETDNKTRTDILLNEVKGNVRTINEYRKIEGLKPVKGGDEIMIFNQFQTLNSINAADPSSGI